MTATPATANAASATPASGREKPARLAFLLALLATLGPYSIDAFFPSMRAIAREFGVSYFQVQQVLTAFMIPYACMSLLHGGASDALGRRRVIMWGTGLYTLASIGCVVAPTFAWLLVARFLQGTVAGAGQIVGRAIIRDRFHGVHAQRIMSMVSMIFALGPALAPIIGGWVHVWFGWRAVFGTMALYGLILLVLVWKRLPETLPVAKRSALHLPTLARGTWRIMRNREFYQLTLASALCFVALQVYLGSAPAIVLDHWHLKETSFARLMLPIITGYSLGAFISGRLAGRFPPERQARIGFSSLLVPTGAMLLLQLFVAEPPIWIQEFLLLLAAAGLQLMFPIVTLRILDLFPNARGAAASAHSFVSLILGSMTMGVLAPWIAVSMRRLAITAFCVNLCGWLMWQVAERYRIRHHG